MLRRSSRSVSIPKPYFDLYYRTMEMSWPAFALAVSIAFVTVNIFFAIIYAILPDAISNFRANSFVDGFLFSVDTLATVGYGTMAPKTSAGHLVASAEILCGFFFSATITGLVFARFSRPRSCIIFSDVAVVGRYDDRPALMVRLTSTRNRPLADVVAQVSWLERRDRDDGRLTRRLIDLPLVRSRLPALRVTWNLIHLLDSDGALLEAIRTYPSFNLIVSVTGMDTLLASQTVGGKIYQKEDILVGYEYADVLSEVEGVVQVDMTRFHDVAPEGMVAGG